MSPAVHPQSVEWGKLHLALNLQREIACGSSDQNKIVNRDDDLALGHDDAIDCSAVDDAGDPAPEVSAGHRVYNVSGQDNSAREARTVVQHGHENPQAEVRGQNYTPSARSAVLFCTHDRNISAPCSTLCAEYFETCRLCHPQFADCATLGEEPASVLSPRETPAEAGNLSQFTVGGTLGEKAAIATSRRQRIAVADLSAEAF